MKQITQLVTLLVVSMILAGCNLVAVNVHQSVRQVDPVIGDGSKTDVELIRGNDTKEETDSATVPVSLVQ